MNTQFIRNGIVIPEKESGRRAFVKAPTVTAVDSLEPTGHKWALAAGRALLTGLLILATAIMINRGPG